jgi:hypothetical protein
MVRRVAVAGVLVSVLAGGTALAQPADARAPDRMRAQRYQIGVMERILEEAVEHGATVTRDRLQALVPPAEMLLTESARVRGFRLEGYGMFFDVVVPNLEGTLGWSFRMLDQTGLGLDSALDSLRKFIAKTSDANLEQALKRIELQVAAQPGLRVASPDATPAARAAAPAGLTPLAGTAAAVAEPGAGAAAADSILSDPDEAYRTEVQNALMDAMLDHSRGLALAPNDWLMVAARRDQDRGRLAPVDTDARTIQIRVRGGDLAAFLAGQIAREEARRRMDVRVF